VCPATPQQSKESNPLASYPSLLIQTDLYDFVMIKKATRFHQLSLLLLESVSSFALGQFPTRSAYGWFCLIKVRNRNMARPSTDERYGYQYFQSHAARQDNVWL